MSDLVKKEDLSLSIELPTVPQNININFEDLKELDGFKALLPENAETLEMGVGETLRVYYIGTADRIIQSQYGDNKGQLIKLKHVFYIDVKRKRLVCSASTQLVNTPFTFLQPLELSYTGQKRAKNGNNFDYYIFRRLVENDLTESE